MTELTKVAALALPLIGGVSSFFYVNARAIISYKMTSLRFGHKEVIAAQIVEPVDSWFTLAAMRIELRNRSFKHLSGLKTYVDHVPERYIARVVTTGSISVESIGFSRVGEALLIQVEEVPRGETVTIDVLQRGASLYTDRLRGGGNKYKLIPEHVFRMDRLGTIGVGIGIGGIIGQVLIFLG